jgi:bile acid:Na+ symporter, BASS family
MLRFRQLCLSFAGLGLLGLIVGLVMGSLALWQPSAVVLAVGLAIGIGAVPSLKVYQFTLWIIATVTIGLTYPGQVLHWGDFDLRNKWLILIAVQTVMFGMGTQMSLKDFLGVMKMPWGVVVAVLGQFTIMPIVGWTLTRVFHLPDEIAAGVILVGCCSSGLASNVMCYVAKANLALSITATSITTMLAPFMTPMWMKLLAGTLVDVSFFGMMVDIVKIVLVPIGATMLHDYLKSASPRGRLIVHSLAGLGAAWAGFLSLGGFAWLGAGLSADGRTALELSAFVLGASTAGVIYHQLTRLWPKIDSLMPRLSMLGIMYFTTITTAAGRDNLLKVGGTLFVVAVLHNALGYFLGYWGARAGGLDKASCRTVAIEVGLQNGGMASGLAGAMGKLATVGLGAAVFGSWMNVSGSILANYWAKRPVDAAPRKP